MPGRHNTKIYRDIFIGLFEGGGMISSIKRLGATTVGDRGNDGSVAVGTTVAGGACLRPPDRPAVRGLSCRQFWAAIDPLWPEFQINGYTWGNNVSALNAISGMVYGGLEHTDGDMRKGNELPTSGPMSHFAANDNWTVDQASLFYGGRITENLGVLAQATYKNPNASFTWDNTDIRYADSADVRGTNVVYGITLNNNPSVQDVWQTTPGWWFPYLASGLAPAPSGALVPQLLGAQAQKVAGLGAYALWNDLLYTEISAYHSLSPTSQRTLGITGSQDADYLKGINPYWRVALQHDYGVHYVALGTYGMIFYRYPGNDRSQGSDKLTDYAVDATYQATLAGGDHIISVYATALRETLNSKAMFQQSESGRIRQPERSHVDLWANTSDPTTIYMA